MDHVVPDFGLTYGMGLEPMAWGMGHDDHREHDD